MNYINKNMVDLINAEFIWCHHYETSWPHELRIIELSVVIATAGTAASCVYNNVMPTCRLFVPVSESRVDYISFNISSKDLRNIHAFKNVYESFIYISYFKKSRPQWKFKLVFYRFFISIPTTCTTCWEVNNGNNCMWKFNINEV